MATLAEHPVVAPASYDQDIDSFLNLDQLSYTSSEPARSKIGLTTQPSLPSSEFAASEARSASFASSGQSPIAFQAPSHQYDEHKQQTGLPPGALAQAMTYNHMTPMYNTASPGFPMNGEMFQGQVKRDDGPMDFNSAPPRNPSEMDLESDNSMGAVPGYYFSPSPNKTQFVDPNALGGHELVSVGPSTQVGRMYPGMHQQQAAMAKAAQQQRQHELLRQQQQQQQQFQHPRQEMQHPEAPRAQHPHLTNPLVEERISLLLQQVKQTAVTSPSASPSPSSIPQMTKAKKDEQDMDEDERLLASEEGKKLSSKERRQLRNKVSARAFRSRRKEYIGQLESEVAARTNEAHELRVQNRTLYEENARLTDLARMLLSSPHFSQFLDEMNVNSVPVPSQAQPHQPQQSQPQPQPQQPALSQAPMPQGNMPKDPAISHGQQEFSMSQGSQVGMMMVPNQAMDVSAMNMNNGGWNSGIDMNFGNAPVFAVLEVPEPAIVDAEILSGKSSSFVETYIPEISSSKDDAPVLERLSIVEQPQQQTAVTGVENPDVEIDESDPAFALFVDQPRTTPAQESAPSFEGIQSDKAPSLALVVENDSKTAANRLAYLCDSMEAAFQRVSLMTSHLHFVLAKLASLQLSERLFDRAFRGLVSLPPSRASFSTSQSTQEKKDIYYKGPLHIRSPRNTDERTTIAFQNRFIPSSHIIRAPRLSNNRGKFYIFFKDNIYRPRKDHHLPPPTGVTPMKFNYQLLTTPTADTPGTTLLLHFPDKRYLFGQISEGTQRACTEGGTKVASVSDIFLSGRLEWSNTGGLIGMILTQADGLSSSASAAEQAAREKEANRLKYSVKKGKAGDHSPVVEETPAPEKLSDSQHELTIHGGRNLAHTLATARRFVFRKGTPVYTREYDTETLSKKLHTNEDDPFQKPTWSDQNIKVWAMPISPSSAPPPRPKSPRKRSLDEFRETADTSDSSLHLSDQLMRESVVADMFNSSWSLDALVETRLSQVKMPAVMFVRNPQTKDLEKYTGPAPGSNEPLPDITVLVRKPWPGAAIEKIPTATKNEESLCYIIKNHDIRGRFYAPRALALGVKPGPDFGALTKGGTVTVDGNVITPEMVLGPPRLGQGMVIVDLPTPEYVENFVNRPEWKSPSITTNLAAFIWILGPGVGEHPRLLEFVQKMSKSKHIVSSTDYCPNYLAMKIPVHDNATLPQTSYSAESTSLVPTTSSKALLTPAEPGLIVEMEPLFKLDSSVVVPRLNTAKILKQMPVTAQKRAQVITTRLKKAKAGLQRFLKDLPGADAEIITLGTGSSTPSKYRNVSSTLIRVPKQGYYLLDCGENTLGQLKRMYNPEQLREVLRNLRMIWISHLHADHHLGTVSVIKAWYEENYPGGHGQSDSPEMDMATILKEKRLFLVSEQMMIEWLEEYAGVEDFGFGKMVPLSATPVAQHGTIHTTFHYRHCRPDGSYPGRDLPTGKPVTTELSFTDETSPLTPLLRRATGLSDLLTTRVSHCRGALAVSLVYSDGFKASFSGDCRPSDNFALIGRGSTVLIHESTFQDDMIGSAIAKRHSTASEAIAIGHKMHARAILLTHFSQRYQKVQYREHPAATAAKPDQARPISSSSVRPQSSTAPTSPHPKNKKDNEEDVRMTDIPVDELDNEDDNQPLVTSTPPPTSPPPAPEDVPIVAAFDYMRVRIRDMYALEAYSPAIENLLKMIERQAEQEWQLLKTQREENETTKSKVRIKAYKQGAVIKRRKQAGEREQEPEPEPELSFDTQGMTPPQPPKHLSVWSASESESGWSTSDYESETEDTRQGAEKENQSEQWKTRRKDSHVPGSRIRGSSPSRSRSPSRTRTRTPSR
ncbi:hypothetical protein AOCH_000644 [Aspergillus ochraceoroseus]|uniref:ribonuclease Z n=1 Tax=Aspergillus ochraceoroseus TaxID=138278 RepID=A0A0F8U851_9EURO|nr:hypothetical protein AOCH_000644 [Aspergillus ochraceoroseus]